MIPISESVSKQRAPRITSILVLICLLFFFYELTLPAQALDRFLQRWGANPQLILLALAGDPGVPRTELLTLFTSQFLHGGWLHLLGNMMFLWVFGRAVEDYLGHLVFLVLYLLGGAGAGLFQSWVSDPHSSIVLVGASGSIATVLGCYLILFPTAWVRVLVPIFFFFWSFDIPAALMLALWFFGQFFTGIASISNVAVAGNVAVWAHVAGFVLGAGAGIALRGAARGSSRSISRHANAPGPAGLISSIATLANLFLFARILLHLLEIPPGAGALGQVAELAYRVTDPFVNPLNELVPWFVVLGRPIDAPALVVMLLVYLIASLLVHDITNTHRGRQSKRTYR
ncbi:MAG: rhomboid family intramembrane serine protease [Chloroflexota bacterium]